MYASGIFRACPNTTGMTAPPSTIWRPRWARVTPAASDMLSPWITVLGMSCSNGVRSGEVAWIVRAPTSCCTWEMTAEMVSATSSDRKSTRLNSQSRLHLVCRLLLEKRNTDVDYSLHGTQKNPPVHPPLLTGAECVHAVRSRVQAQPSGNPAGRIRQRAFFFK